MARQPSKKRNEFGELYDLLCRALPERRTKRDGVLDVRGIAEELGMTPEGIYKCLRANKITAKLARKITDLPDCERSMKAFTAYLA